MIQIYSPGNTNFKQNGDMTLFPEICETSSELGGAWTLEITHPIDEESRWKYIEKEAVLSVPTHMGENQLYRIDKITGKTDAEISAKAYPIFYDSADEVFLMDKRPTDKTAQMALDILTEGTKYSGQSDISGLNTAYFVRRNLMDCICGEDTPSFIGTWGGEPLYDNYKVIINKRAGGDHGAEVRYGKNIVGVNVTEDMSEVVTRIVPVAYNGRLLSTLSVDSPLINNYAKIYTKEIKFEDVRYFEDIEEGTDTTGLIVCNSQEELDAALIQKCNEQFEAGIDLFKVTIDIDMVSLENTEEYKDFKDLVKIGLGDDVACYHTRLGIQTKARAIKLVWDCITNSAKEVVLGDYQYNFLQEWNSQMSQVKKDVGTLFDQLENPQSSFRVMMQNTIDSMAASIAGYDGGNMIITQNEAGKPNGIMIMDTDSKDTAKKVLWFNLNGITYSSNGADGPFSTVWSFEQGGFGADWIVTGTLIANLIKAGTLSDALGLNFWDLDNGVFSMQNGTMNMSGQIVYTKDSFTQEDLEIVRQIVAGTLEPTAEYIAKYDVYGDCDISNLDLEIIESLVNGTRTQHVLDTTVTIDPKRQGSIIRTNGTNIGTNGMYAYKLNSHILNAKYLFTKDLEGNTYSGVSTEVEAGGYKLVFLNGLLIDIEKV